MKKSVFLMLTGALALGCLASCQREKEVVDVNPTYNAEANTVKADFVLNVSTPASDGSTKTTQDFAQAGNSPTFLGMEAVHLLAYDLGDRDFFYIPAEKVNTAEEGKDPVYEVKKFPALRDFDLGSLFGPGEVTNSKSSRSIQLAVPVGTNAMLLYGKAKKTASSDLQGAVTTTGDVKDISTIAFSLVPRLSTEKKPNGFTDKDAFDVTAFVFARCLNHLLAAGLVDEKTFWTTTTGTQDRSYAFWWPQTGAPAFSVGTAVGQYTKKVADDGSVTYVENVAEPEEGQPAPTPKVLKHGDKQGNFTFRCGQLSWKQLGLMYDYYTDDKPATHPEDVSTPSMEMTLLGESVGEAYSALTTIVEKGSYQELRAGSAFSVLHTMEDLYTIVYKAASAGPLNWEEQVVKLLAQEIKRRMDLLFVYEGGKLYYLPTYTEDGEGKKTWNLNTVDVSTILERAEAAGSPSTWSPYSSMTSLITQASFPVGDSKGFPLNLGLPYGAACLACSVTKPDLDTQKKTLDSFSYVTEIPAYGMGKATFPITNYRYPPELMYYANSPIRVSNNVVDAFPQSVSAWDSDAWDGWTKGAVTSTTRSVALVNHINYGTALLETNISYASGLTELEDNYSFTHPGQPNNIIPITNNKKSANGFVVTGIVIGGQPNTVCWDYTRAPDDNNVVWKWDESAQLYTDDSGSPVLFNKNPFDKMIYDKVVRDSDYVIGTTDDNIYTFAWDNYDATLAADSQSDVFIALEILNDTGKDFYGELNLIRNGGTFYLIGKLDMSKAKKPTGFDLTGTPNYFYPPFKTQDGSTVNAPRVFMQNYMTKAKIVLNRTALQHAYVTMPDLRSSQITLGLVIDMTWQKGLEFSVEIGENPNN